MRRASTSDWLRRAMRTFDAAIAMAVSMLVLFSLNGLDHTQGIEYPLLIVVGGLLLPACGEVLGLYQAWRGQNLFTMLGVYALGWLMTIVLLCLFLVITQSSGSFSRLWMVLSALGVLCSGIAVRSMLYHFLRRLRARGRNLKRVVIIGPDANVAKLRRRLAEMPYIGYMITEEIHDQDLESLSRRITALATKSAFQRDFDEIWLTFPLSQGEIVKQLASQLMTVPVDLRYFPDLTDVRLLNHRIALVAGMYSLDLNHSPLSGFSRVVKALEDRVLGSLLFLLFIPVMLVVAVLVRWQMGSPVLFKQQRHGLDGKPFRIYKFRTMKQQASKGDGRQARQGDPRVTRLGALLRRTSLDELPQLYNVLQGRMSLVGPRPHAMIHNEQYKDKIEIYMQRHRVMPGMTGWAQVNGLRGIAEDVDLMRKRVEYDLYYIDNWSLRLDLKILAMTVTRGFINQQP